jgi:hypothetical protein
MLVDPIAAALVRLDERLLAACDEEEARARLLAGDGQPGWDGVRNLARPAAHDLLERGNADRGEALYESGHPVLDRLRRAGLDGMACDVMVVLLAAHIEPRYQSLYAVLQDDLQQRRATQRLLGVVLATTAGRRRALAATLSPGGPLVRSGFVLRIAGHYPPLARPFDLADEVVDALLGDPEPGVPGALRQRWRPPASTHDGPSLSASAGGTGHGPLLGSAGLQVVHGPGDVLAAARRLLADDVPSLEVCVPPGTGGAPSCSAAWRIGLCTGVPVVVDLSAWPQADAESVIGELAALMRSLGGSLTVCTRGPVPVEVPHVEAAAPGWAARRHSWAELSAANGLRLSAGGAGRLASLHRLDEAEVAEVVRIVVATSSADGAGDDEQRLREAADRMHVTDVPRTVRTVPRRTFADLALAPTTREALDRLVHYVSRRDALAAEQGLAHRYPVDRGPLVLFSGRPGTGKTAAAEAVAHALGRPLHTVDISQLLSKYIGDSEKHIHDVLKQAQQSAGILLCDEADALFASRKEHAEGAGEQFANVLVGYLLQRIEHHDGVVILSTNLRNAIDEAFSRRFQFRVEFPMPAPAERLGIWQLMLVPGVPRAADLDLQRLADEHELSGGDISNAALRAVFMADREGAPVRQEHLDRAIALELLEQGRLARRDPGSVPGGSGPGGSGPGGSGAGGTHPDDHGALLRAVADTVAFQLRAQLRRHFLKEVHVVHGSPTERALSGRRPAVSLALFRLAARRASTGLRAGFIASAWSSLAEEEYELVGVVHEVLVTLDLNAVKGRPARLRVQESSDFDLLHKFWTSHDRPIRASVVFDVEID